MDDDSFVLRWAAHYAPSILLLAISGAVAAVLFLSVIPREHEGWSYVLETNNQIPPLQLGNVAEAVFLTQKVYGPAMRKLGTKESPVEFLEKSVELRPVPGTNTLIVVGRSGDLRQAERISSAMADSLVDAFAARQPKAHFVRFGSAQPAPIPTNLSRKVGAALGAAIGLWLGLAIAVIHYRWRRPALTMSSAVGALDPDVAASVVLRRRWLVSPSGPLERTERPRLRGRLQTVLPGRGTLSDVQVVVPGLGRRRQERLAGVLSSALGSTATDDGLGSPGSMTVVVCTASSRLEDLRELSKLGPWNGPDGNAAPLALVWVR